MRLVRRLLIDLKVIQGDYPRIFVLAIPALYKNTVCQMENY